MGRTQRSRCDAPDRRNSTRLRRHCVSVATAAHGRPQGGLKMPGSRSAAHRLCTQSASARGVVYQTLKIGRTTPPFKTKKNVTAWHPFAAVATASNRNTGNNPAKDRWIPGRTVPHDWRRGGRCGGPCARSTAEQTIRSAWAQSRMQLLGHKSTNAYRKLHLLPPCTKLCVIRLTLLQNTVM